nr:hypothetical protein [Corynebacterium glucuronolyticum]
MLTDEEFAAAKAKALGL